MARLCVLIGWLSLSSAAAAAADLVSDVKSDERIIFMPTLAHPIEGGRAWSVDVHGWIFESEWTGRAAVDAFRGALELKISATPAEAALFDRRAQLFVVDNERGKNIVVRLGGTKFRCDPSAPNGHFTGRFRIVDADMSRLRSGLDENDPIRFEAVLGDGDDRRFAGEVYLLDGEGLSVVSDIDDTIKITEVHDVNAVLINTFFRPYRAAPGMAVLYRAWAERPGARFHYLSAGTWQLYEPLEEFREQAGFPAGTWHLQLFRWKDRSIRNVFASPAVHKRKVLKDIIAASGRRRFILVGDSGQRDPEIYAEITRAFPDRIEHIYIRDVTKQPSTARRYERVFEGLSADRWTVFRDGAELAATAAR